MTETDPLAQLASTAFRAWATVTQAGVDAALSVLRQFAEGAYEERDVPIVGRGDIPVAAPVGARLSATPFVLVDRDTGTQTKDASPSNVISAAEIAFDPATVPPPEANVASPVVTIRLLPTHAVRTGVYMGSVLADGKELPRIYRVYVSGEGG